VVFVSLGSVLFCERAIERVSVSILASLWFLPTAEPRSVLYLMPMMISMDNERN
jgi:hypothetical protein